MAHLLLNKKVNKDINEFIRNKVLIICINRLIDIIQFHIKSYFYKKHISLQKISATFTSTNRLAWIIRCISCLSVVVRTDVG